MSEKEGKESENKNDSHVADWLSCEDYGVLPALDVLGWALVSEQDKVLMSESKDVKEGG